MSLYLVLNTKPLFRLFVDTGMTSWITLHFCLKASMSICLTRFRSTAVVFKTPSNRRCLFQLPIKDSFATFSNGNRETTKLARSVDDLSADARGGRVIWIGEYLNAPTCKFYTLISIRNSVTFDIVHSFLSPIKRGKLSNRKNGSLFSAHRVYNV